MGPFMPARSLLHPPQKGSQFSPFHYACTASQSYPLVPCPPALFRHLQKCRPLIKTIGTAHLHHHHLHLEAVWSIFFFS